MDLRKNRAKPPRPRQWTRGFQEHGFAEEATTGEERVRAKGELSRRRTIIQDDTPGAGPAGEQGFPGAGWAHHQQPVSAGQRDLERAPGLDLAPDLGEVGHVGQGDCGVGSEGGVRLRRKIDPLGRRWSAPAGTWRPDQFGSRAEGRHGEGFDPTDESRLGEPVLRDDRPPDATSRERGEHREEPRYVANFAAERQLAEHGPAPVRPNLLGSEEDPERDPEIK